MSHSSVTAIIIKYIVGFTSAMLLSAIAYLVVVEKWFETSTQTMTVLLVLAAVQLLIQLICFLHLGVRGSSASRTLAIVYTLLMMLVIVVGSLWVVGNLDYRMGMSPEAMNEYMIEQNKKGF